MATKIPRSTLTDCPDDEIVNCLADPCDVNFCPAHPGAKCVSDFCGGCNAQFFAPGGEVEVTDTCNCPDLVNCFIDPRS